MNYIFGIFSLYLVNIATPSIAMFAESEQANPENIKFESIESIGNVVDVLQIIPNNSEEPAECAIKESKSHKYFSFFSGKKVKKSDLPLRKTLIIVDFDETIARTAIYLKSCHTKFVYAAHNESGRTFKAERDSVQRRLGFAKSKDLISRYHQHFEHEYEPLEGSITKDAIASWLDAGATIIICSGKARTKKKEQFLSESLGIKRKKIRYEHVPNNKIAVLDRVENLRTFSTIVFIDNYNGTQKNGTPAPASVASFLEAASYHDVIIQNNIHVIGMHLTFFEHDFLGNLAIYENEMHAFYESVTNETIDMKPTETSGHSSNESDPLAGIVAL